MEERRLEEKELAVYKNRKEAFKRAPKNIQTALENKVEKHNKAVNNAKTKKTDKFTLAVVFWRGVGAYKGNPESVRPSVVSAEQWGLGRVNGFLYALKNGKFKVKPYDQDLLPKGHPHSSRSIDSLLIRSVSRFNDDLPLADKDEIWGWFAGDNDDTLDGDNWERYKKAHAWFDPSNPESKSSYKLPFAKVIDGELKVVFRGVASAMGAITRELKGQDPKQDIENIPKRDFIKIYELLSKYYKKFGEEPPEFPDRRKENRDLGVYKEPKNIPDDVKDILFSKAPDSMQFNFRELPYPNDEETEEELKFLIDISKYRKLYHDYIVKADVDLIQPFMEFLEKYSLTLTKEMYDGMNTLLKESTVFILKLKYYYNRPRPYQVAERLGYNFMPMNSETAHTPSYPSGHTIQAMMLADYFGQFFSEYKSYLYEIADKISMSRVFGGYHFPSDIKYGKMIFADYMKYKKQDRALGESIGDIFDDAVVAEKLEFEDLLVDLKDLKFVERSKDEVTNFPKSGDNLKVSLRNSNWQVFPIDFAEKIKKDYPSIWDKGGNIKGNDQYRDLVPVQKRGGNVINKREEDAVRLREAWVARHFKDFRIAGVIAQIKWLAVGSRGLKYMKDLVREEMKKVDEKKNRTFNTDQFTVIDDTDGLLLKSKDKLQMSIYVDHLIEQRNVEKKDKDFVISGIASSTSVDHYGTEMSLDALKGMKEQILKGVVILPRHETLSGGAGLAEWDEVIGRTLSSSIKRADIKEGAVDDVGYILEVTSRLYMEDARAKNLMRRLNRGELIGQSIGGWFDKVRVIEGKDGGIERVIVEEVTLDHIAITRAPANPDSYGLSLFNVRSKLNNFLNGSHIMSEQIETRDLDDSSVVVKPEVGEQKEETGDANVEPVLGEHPLQKEERATPLEEELHGELEELEDKYDELKDEYLRLKEEYEQMKASNRKEEVALMKDEMERMKKEMEEMDKAKEEMAKQEEERMMKEKERMKDDEERMGHADEERMGHADEERMGHADEEEERMKEEMAKEELSAEERMGSLMEKMMKEELSVKEKEELRKIMERMMYEKSEEKNKSSETENKNTELVDNRSISDNDLNNNTNISLGEEDMNEKQMQEFATLIARSVAEAVKPTVATVETVETTVETQDVGIEELRSELARTQNMLAEVMKNPVRRGRHLTTTIRGAGAKSAYSELISRSRAEGTTALSAVVEENVDALATDKVADMSSHQLRALLSAGLNAAQRDGLLGQPIGSWE